MRCRIARKRLIEYLDGGLTASERTDLEKHMESCNGCAKVLKKLELSGDTLSSAQPVELTKEASERILHNLRHQFAIKEPSSRLSRLFGSRRAVAIAGATAVILFAVVVVGGITAIFVSDSFEESSREVSVLETKSAEDSAEGATEILSTGAEDTSSKSLEGEGFAAEEQALSELLRPVVVISQTDYTDASLRAMIENLELRKQIEKYYTLVDALDLKRENTEILVTEFAGQGEDGEILGNIMEYITKGESALLPYYVEKALYGGRQVLYICLAGPPRTGDSNNLTRTEIWVIDPAVYPTNPDGSLVNFMQYQSSRSN